MVGIAKPKAVSLHIGVNRVDPIHYAGWKGELVSYENDDRDMERIAGSQGFVNRSLLTNATATAVLAAIEKAAKELFEDDFFLLTYSGYGGQVNDVGKRRTLRAE
jgi:metacaspase-1